jgi:hypothetical protein
MIMAPWPRWPKGWIASLVLVALAAALHGCTTQAEYGGAAVDGEAGGDALPRTPLEGAVFEITADTQVVAFPEAESGVREDSIATTLR